MKNKVEDDDDEEEDDEEDVTLEDINEELDTITKLANLGKPFDEKRMDYLLHIRSTHPDHIDQLAEEREEWLQSVEQFIYQCQERVRTFVPVDIFSTSFESLIEQGLSPEVAKRILQKQCLWLVRMSTAEIARLHESDLLGRFNSLGHNLDIIETAAVFASLPDKFCNDNTGKKLQWRNDIEENLKKMLFDNENDLLAEAKIRAVAYNGLQYGPIKDISSVREYKIIATSEGMYKKRSAYEELGISESNSYEN
jgi:hypothetical protein